MSERRRLRWTCGGGKNAPTNPYDPQIGQAASQEAATAQQAENFTEGFYNNQLSPLLGQMTAASKQAQGEQQQLFNTNMAQTNQAVGLYNSLGVPAIQNYYNQAAQFSTPAYQQQQAQLALGDMKTSEASQAQQTRMQMASMGLNAASPMAMMMQHQNAVANASNEAAAMNRARQTAQQMGLNVAANTANFANTGAAGILNFGGAAGGNAMSGFGLASGALGSAGGAQQGMLQGYGLAGNMYGANLNAYTSLGNTGMQIEGQEQSALGQGIGSLLGIGAMGAMHMLPSDRRLKTDIRHVGYTRTGLRLYSFNYVWGGPRQTGVMADEVERVIPEAVRENFAGYKMVDYGMVL